MALTDFLTNGQIPAGSAAVSKTSTSVLPSWYTQYAKDLLTNQTAVAGRPYTPAPMPRVADFTAQQQQGFGMTGQAATAYQPALGAATTATQQALGAPTGASVAQPYAAQASNFTQAGAQGLGMQMGTPMLQTAADLSAVGAAIPSYQQAMGTTAQGMQAIGQQAAQPYLSAAGGNTTDVSSYMNPYVQSVVNQAAALGERNLREQLMPAIEGRYIGAGQLGGATRGGGLSGAPSGMMTDTARALRDTQESVLNQQGQLLSQGYGQAQSAMQADLARQAQLASTAGQLGTAQQGALQNAAQQQAAIGTSLGNLTQGQQQGLTTIGSQLGQLGTAQQNALLQAGQQTGALGTSMGGLQQQGTTQQLNAAQQMAGLGAQAQQLGLAGAGALTQVGGAQQGLNQQNLDVAYQDFLRQQGYPQEQINNMLATYKGLQGTMPSVSTEEGIQPTGAAYSGTPSDLSSIAGVASGLIGLLK
jgi:hypothetical protein